MKQADYLKGDYPWIPDNGDGTYTNPVLFADYSDPDVIRVGEDYYLTASSFNQSPGLPILHSKDLVNWTILAYALPKLPGSGYDRVRTGCGVWAPALRWHDGKFWIFFPMPDEGIFVTAAENPAGPWEEPWLLQEGKGIIDPCPLWDDDGRGWLIFAYAESRSGIKHRLHLRPMSPDGRRLMGPGKIVFDGAAEHPTLEGPKLHKIKGRYYISAPAGGVPYGWQVILRSSRIDGPYDESKIVMEQNGSMINGPHQGALVDDIDGNWWFLHFQEHKPYGRICHLQPVEWREGWPLMGALSPGNTAGTPVLRGKKPAGGSPVLIPQSSDEFDSPELGRQWAFRGNPGKGTCSLSARRGWLRLKPILCGKPQLAKAAHALIQKTPCRRFQLETLLDFSAAEEGCEAGLALFGQSTSALVLNRTEGKTRLGLRQNDEMVMSREWEGKEIRMVLNFGRGGFCQFGWAEDARIRWFGPAFLPRAEEGSWIGVRTGLFCSAHGPLPIKGHADFRYYRYS